MIKAENNKKSFFKKIRFYTIVCFLIFVFFFLLCSIPCLFFGINVFIDSFKYILIFTSALTSIPALLLLTIFKDKDAVEYNLMYSDKIKKQNAWNNYANIWLDTEKD